MLKGLCAGHSPCGETEGTYGISIELDNGQSADHLHSYPYDFCRD